MIDQIYISCVKCALGLLLFSGFILIQSPIPFPPLCLFSVIIPMINKSPLN